MNVGVLALQGAVAEHMRCLEAVGANVISVKRVEQLEHVQALVIPGGESTTIGKLMDQYGFSAAIRTFARQGKSIFGTCAGLICLAERVKGYTDAEKNHLQLMDITVMRNAFGRQRESFETDLYVKGIEHPIRAIFIRAPLIESVGKNVEVLCEVSKKIVAVRQNNLLACSFHPELTDDVSLHQYFIEMVKQQ